MSIHPRPGKTGRVLELLLDCGGALAKWSGFMASIDMISHQPMKFLRSYQWMGFHRETEATSNLSAMLTVSGLVTLFVVRRLGLALGELDHKGGWSNTKEVQGGETVKTE